MVQLRPDQERVRTLIKETITLLCKNGLSFDAHFSIDALIGVTLDDKDVFLVNINELVKSEKAQAAESQKQAELSSEGDVSEDDSTKKKHPRWTSSQKRKRRKHSIKSEHGQEVESSSDENTAEYSPDEAMSQATRHPPPTSNRTGTNNIKREQREDSDNEQNNVIIIKEELDDSWQGTGNHGSHDDSSFGQFTDMPGTSQDQNFSSLADMSLMPVAPQDASQVWAQSAAYSSSSGGGAGRGMPRTTATSGSQQLDSAQEVFNSSQKRFKCHICGSFYSSKNNLAVHVKLHKGQYQYYCKICGKGCGSTAQLKGHTAVHTGEQLFTCNICGRGFNYKTHFKYHMKKHEIFND